MSEVGAAPYRLPSGCPHFDHHMRYVDDNTDRYQDYDALRGERVAWSDAYGGFWILTHYEDVVQAESDWRTFSSAGAVVSPVQSGRRVNQVALEQDPPEHTLYRHLYQDLLSRARVAAATPYITEVARRRVDDLAARGGGDFVAQVAVPFPIEIVAYLLGLDADMVAELRTLSEQAWAALSRPAAASAAVGATPARASAVPPTLGRLLRAELQRRRDQPRDDFLTELAGMRVDGEPMPELGLASFLVGAVIAGHDTTLAAAANLAYQLAIEPALARRLREQPALIPRAIDESLRHRSPVQNFFRTVTRPVRIGGVAMAAGDRVMLLYGAANRDPNQFGCPERFDLDRYDSNREARGHLAYGYGVHRCAGAHLAEVELRMLLDAVLRYDLQLDGDVSFAPTAHGAFLALTELPLRLTAPAMGDLLPR